MINSFKTEAEFRGKITMRSDLICKTNDSSVRLELTWRKWASSGEISKYVLDKLQKYGQAIGLLE
jgi:DNA (cytosine-5)-methyltransferase 1